MNNDCLPSPFGNRRLLKCGSVSLAQAVMGESLTLIDNYFFGNRDKNLVAAVGWNLSNELFTCSDDQTIWRWSRNGEALDKVLSLETYFTGIHWFPSMSQRLRGGPGFDTFVVACTDGTFRIIGKGGAEESKIEAHEGAVICLRWNFEGTALATGGEDGLVKIWSRSGMHRSTLAQNELSVYALAWGPGSDQILYSCGRDLIMKPIQSASKQILWEAHDGLVLSVDWNPVTNCIVSGGEDAHYKVWDCYGRMMYQSPKADSTITSVAWCPSGEFFAIGHFNTLLLCDKAGWVHSKLKPESGSLLSIAWSTDGTQLAGAGGNGSVLLGQLIDVRLEWDRILAILASSNQILIQDLVTETVEELDFRDRVVKMSLGFNHLVVATAAQCCIYSITNWNTPHIFDIKDTVILLKQCQRYFLMVDCHTGLHLYTYEGRHICNPKFQGLRIEAINNQTVSLSDDTLAIIDSSDSKSVRYLDASTGKSVGDLLRHGLEIVEMSLSQLGSSSDRKLVFVDCNHDLYITPVLRQIVFKLAAMVDTAVWNDSADMVAGIVDQKLVFWYYPQAAYVDKDLLVFVKLAKEIDLGKTARIQGFHKSKCNIRRADGSSVSTIVLPAPLLLSEHVAAKQWEHALRLCRFVKDNLLWACLAAMAMDAKELSTAEVAYAALDEVDKVHYILHLKDLASEEARQAEIALFKRRPEEAESILLQAGLVYRAINMNLRLFNWTRALELAVTYKVHVDTVLCHREKYLTSTKQNEDKPQFIQLAQQIVIDPVKIQARIEQEKGKEQTPATRSSTQLF